MLLFDKFVISPIVVGRDRELNFFADVLGRGMGQCVLVAGEAGVGKSRLVAEVSRRAEPLGVAAFRGVCFGPEVSFPYGAVVDGLRATFAGRTQAEIGELVGSLGPELVKLVPELGLLLPGVRPSPALEPKAAGCLRSLAGFSGSLRGIARHL